jgi:hypothetical protein
MKEEKGDTKKENENKEETKREDTNNDQKPSKKTLKKEHKQFIFVLIIIGVAFISFLLPYYYVQNQRVFEFNNMTWQVEKDVDVTFYHTQFGKYYKDQYLGVHNTFLRNDPRENTIPSDISNPQFYRKVAITTDKELLECDKQILVTDAIAQMTQALPFIQEVSFGITDEELANTTNREYITCESEESTTVIHVKKGETSLVTQTNGGDCMIVQIGTCKENIITSEKLILEVISELNQ